MQQLLAMMAIRRSLLADLFVSEDLHRASHGFRAHIVLHLLVLSTLETRYVICPLHKLCGSGLRPRAHARFRTVLADSTGNPVTPVAMHMLCIFDPGG